MISIIVPVRNEIDYIRDSLESILNQDTNDEYEILIVDGMSTDGTREVIKEYQSKFSSIHLLDNPETIVPTGFNRALSISKGSIIIRIDGHVVIRPNYISQCLKVLKNSGADCVGGPIINSAKGLVGKSINIAQSSKFGVGGVSFREKIKKGKYVDTLAFGAYKRDVFKNIGGYDQELIRNQDDEFNFRLIQSGGRIWLDPSIQSLYYPRTSLSKLFKQYYQYGFFKVRVIQKRKGIASYRHAIPLIFILSLAVTSYFYLKYNVQLPFLILLLSYISLTALASINKFIRNFNNWKSTLMLPLVFSTMHFAYGIGSILGLCYLVFKWTDTEIKDSYFDKTTFIDI